MLRPLPMRWWFRWPSQRKECQQTVALHHHTMPLSSHKKSQQQIMISLIINGSVFYLNTSLKQAIQKVSSTLFCLDTQVASKASRRTTLFGGNDFRGNLDCIHNGGTQGSNVKKEDTDFIPSCINLRGLGILTWCQKVRKAKRDASQLFLAVKCPTIRSRNKRKLRSV